MTGWNIGSDFVDHKKNCRCDECEVERLTNRVADLQAQLDAVRGLQKHEVTKDVFSHEYVIVSCGVRNGFVVYVDDIEQALEQK